MSERIRVNTERLKEKSSEFMEVTNSVQKELRGAGAIMENIQTGFYANPVASIQKAFTQLLERSCQKVEELCRHLENLSHIAESYEEAEKENELAVKDN